MDQKEREKHFTPNTLVVWDKKVPQFESVKKFAQLVGDGPFIVTSTADVHSENQEAVGHHQFVKFDVNGTIKTFSGAVLVRYQGAKEPI
ncbi:MAG: hypothetical protein WCV80_01365 [Candidatus Paceibacterota bacterium]|jgi:hypothetical protein